MVDERAALRVGRTLFGPLPGRGVRVVGADAVCRLRAARGGTTAKRGIRCR